MIRRLFFTFVTRFASIARTIARITSIGVCNDHEDKVSPLMPSKIFIAQLQFYIVIETDKTLFSIKPHLCKLTLESLNDGLPRS